MRSLPGWICERRVLGAFIQGGRLSISTLLAWVAPLAAVGLGIAAVTAHIIEANTQLRTFNTILGGMGTASLSSAAGLQAVVKQLRDTGSAAEDAQAAVEAIVRTRGINPAPASVSTIANLARDISATYGTSFEAEAKKLSEALAGGEASAEKFAFSLAGPNGLTAAEAASAQAMARHGDAAGALNVIVAALQRQFGGEFQRSLSGIDNAVTSLSAAWDNLLKKLGETSAITAARDVLKSIFQSIADFLSGDSAKKWEQLWRGGAFSNQNAAAPKALGLGTVHIPINPTGGGYASQGPYAPIGQAAPGGRAPMTAYDMTNYPFPCAPSVSATRNADMPDASD
jgi:hypothetical protein